MPEQEQPQQKPKLTCDQKAPCRFTTFIQGYSVDASGKAVPGVCSPKCPKHPEFKESEFPDYDDVPPSG